MKKTCLFRAAAAALALLFAAAAFAACAKVPDSKKIVGKWETTVDISKMINDSLKEGEAAEELGDVEFKDISIKLFVEFKEDGTYKSSADEESVNAALDKVVEQLVPMLTDIFKTAVAETFGKDASEVTDEEIGSFLALLGMSSMEDMARMMREEMDMADLTGDLEDEGKYMLKDGVLYTTDSVSEEPTEASDGAAYELADKTLKLSVKDGKDAPEGLEEILPLTFTKAD